MIKNISYTIFLLVSCILSFAQPENARVQELLASIEESIPTRLRDPIGIMENEKWSQTPSFKKLQEMIAQDWEKHAPAISTIAPSDSAKTIYFKAAQVLDRDTYLKLIMVTSDRMAAGELHPMQFKWVVYPQSKHLREMWHKGPSGAELKKVAARVREVMANDPNTVRFMDKVISGEVAENNHDSDPAADPSEARKAQLRQSINTASAPTPAPTTAVNPASAPAAPLPEKSSNVVWWIVGLLILAAGVVFVERNKKPKA